MRTREDLRMARGRMVHHPLVTDWWQTPEIFDPDRQRPIWYDGAVWSTTFMTRYTVCLRAIGEVAMLWEEDPAAEEETIRTKDYAERIKWLEDHELLDDEDILDEEYHGRLAITCENRFNIIIRDEIEDRSLYERWLLVKEGPLDATAEEMLSRIKVALSIILGDQRRDSIADKDWTEVR